MQMIPRILPIQKQKRLTFFCSPLSEIIYQITSSEQVLVYQTVNALIVEQNHSNEEAAVIL